MCTCASCKYTDSDQFVGIPNLPFRDSHIPGSAFASWPRGEPAGQRSSDAAYRAHWAHCNAMRPYKEPEKLPSAAGFYACKASTRGEIERVLRQQFGLEPATVAAAEPETVTPGFTISYGSVPVSGKAARKPARLEVVQSGPSIAELLQRAIDMRAERERKAA